MSNEDLKKSVEALAKFTQELSSSRERALAYLVKAGTHTADGQLVSRRENVA